MLRARPLVPLAAGFLAGIATAMHFGVAPALLFLPVCLGVLIFRWRHPALLALFAFPLGGIRQSLELLILPSDAIRHESILGKVDGPPRIYRTLADAEGDAGEDGSFVVGDVQVRFFRQHVPLIGGEQVRVWGRISRPKPATNPGQFDYAAYLKRQGIHYVMNLQRYETLQGPPAASRARAWFRSLFDRGMRPEVGAFLSSIVLGRREAMPDDLRANLQQSGTAHLLAISGQNLVIVMISLWAILILSGVRGRALTLVLLILLGFYVLLTGLQVSIVRSFLMMAAFFGADLAWRRRDALSALGAAALVITLVDPAQIADVGFQLSFAAVLGLSFIAPIFHAFTGRGNPSTSLGAGWFWNRLRMALGVSAAAWLATAPIVLVDFNLLTPGTVFANLLLVPLMSAEFVIGLLHLVAAPVGAASVTGACAEFLFDAVRATSAFVTAIPLSHVYVPAPPVVLLAAYYAALGGWALWCRRTPERPWKPLLALAIVAPLGLSGLFHRAPERPFLAVLDVGRGSCAYLEWPDGRNLMVDCGSLNARDPGASIAARYLWSRGVSRLDTLLLSHPDADHVNGADSVIRLLDVRRVVVTPAFAGRPWPPGVEVVVVERPGAQIPLGDLEILGPPLWEKFARDVPANETSIVLRAAGVLFPGDIEERGVEELLSLPDIRARVLVMPHHGKFFRQHAEFVRRVAPDTILVSAPEGYFSDAVIDALPVKPRITGREGAIEMLLDP